MTEPSVHGRDGLDTPQRSSAVEVRGGLIHELRREVWFLSRDRSARIWLVLAVLAASVATILGLSEVAAQRTTLHQLRDADRTERQAALAAHPDWGGVAYHTFHLTYDPPSRFAFAALGTRDTSPWKHRIRMLALEGQIYESDARNPDFGLIGRFDFAFVAATVAPLLLIFLLFDLRSRERAFGRYELLIATAVKGRLWLTRALTRVAALCLSLLVPLWAAGLVAGSSLGSLGAASLAVVAYIGFWWSLISIVDRGGWPSTFNLTALVGLWLVFSVVIPGAIQEGVDRTIALPDGGDIMLAQREAVNDAWDLPKEETMRPFLERHPEWEEHANVGRPFEWKWYFAFQQVGDQTAEPLSKAYRDGRAGRDRAADLLSWLAPPAKLERVLQRIAETDAEASLAYEERVRGFHAALREFYYPKLFTDAAFSEDAVSGRPEFGRFIAPPAAPMD